MTNHLDLIAARAPISFAFGNNTKILETFNVERVRSYLEHHLGCTRKEVSRALDLHPRTVSKAFRIIRGKVPDRSGWARGASSDYCHAHQGPVLLEGGKCPVCSTPSTSRGAAQ